MGPKKKQIVEEMLQTLLKKIRQMLSIRVLITTDSAITGSQYMIKRREKTFIKGFLLWAKDIYS